MITSRIVALMFLGSLAACGLWEEEDDIALSEVPAAVISGAEGAVDGLEIKSAEAEDKNGRLVYEIVGTVSGVKHEVKVAANGEVLKVETD